MLTKTAALGALLCTGLAVCAVGLDASAASPRSSAQPATVKVALRRITESQYRHTIADVFGSDIKIEARFEPERREDGLLALGSAELSLTSSGFEQYFALASSIAEQTLAKKDRDAFIGCQPQDPAAATYCRLPAGFDRIEPGDDCARIRRLVHACHDLEDVGRPHLFVGGERLEVLSCGPAGLPFRAADGILHFDLVRYRHRLYRDAALARLAERLAR